MREGCTLLSLRQKIANLLGTVYGVGIMIVLFVGALSFLGYVAAFIVGGETATLICTFIYKKAYPVLFLVSSLVVLLGLVKMYIAGEKSMVPTKKNNIKSKKD